MRSLRIPSLLLPVLLVLLLIGTHAISKPAYGAQLGNRSLNLTSNAVGASTEYGLVFNLASAGALGSISIDFCANSPFPDDPCVAPAGLDASGASLDSQQGATGFSLASAGANRLLLTRPTAVATAVQVSYSFSAIVNPSTAGSYFVRLQTYASQDASGSASDYGGIAFAITNTVSITATVPPYLIFCTGITIGSYNCADAIGDYIDFGELSATRTSNASSQLLVATNAGQGFAISDSGTTLASGNNIITALAAGDVSRPGTPQFGLNLRANTTPVDGGNVTGPGTGQPMADYNQPNIYKFVSGDTLVSSTGPDDVRRYTASYIVNIPKTQPAGVYVSTITYVCLANF